MVKPKEKEEQPGLAPTRIRIIMKSTANAGNITQDALHVMTKAAEHFIQFLARSAFRITMASQLQLLKYEHVSELVHSQDNLHFLHQIVPKKITVRKYKEILANGKDDDDECSDSSSESEEETQENAQPAASAAVTTTSKNDKKKTKK